MSSYCDFAVGDPLHGPYHDREYGFPLEDEHGLFERLLLEINQAGLNWGLVAPGLTVSVACRSRRCRMFSRSTGSPE